VHNDILDALRVERLRWAGRLDDTEFLSRVFDLDALPSTNDHVAADPGERDRADL